MQWNTMFNFVECKKMSRHWRAPTLPSAPDFTLYFRPCYPPDSAYIPHNFSPYFADLAAVYVLGPGIVGATREK